MAGEDLQTTFQEVQRQAKEFEDKLREEQLEAFAGVEPSICGAVSVLPLTPQMYVELSGADSPFFGGQPEITAVDIAVFLWRVNPGFTPTDHELRTQFNTFVSVLPGHQCILEIFEYIRRSLSPMPQWSGSNGPKTLGVWPSRLVDMFASEYGWSEEYTLNRPYRRLWQYANRILERTDLKYTQKCREAMELRRKWLEEVNSPKPDGRN